MRSPRIPTFILTMLTLLVVAGASRSNPAFDELRRRGVRMGVELNLPWVRFTFYATKEKWAGTTERKAMFLVQQEDIANIAEEETDTEYKYTFAVLQDQVRETRFLLTADRRMSAAAELQDLMGPDDLMSIDLSLPRKRIRVGETVELTATVEAKVELMLHFSTTCQLYYRVHTEDLRVFGPEESCGEMMTYVHLNPGERKVWKMWVPPRKYRDGELVGVPPGRYVIEVGFVGRNDSEFVPRARINFKVVDDAAVPQPADTTAPVAGPDLPTPSRFHPRELLRGPHRGDIAFVLGTTKGLRGGDGILDSDLVEDFDVSEFQRMRVMLPVYRRLSSKMGLQTPVRLDVYGGRYRVHSKDLADVVNAFYSTRPPSYTPRTILNDSLFADVGDDVKLELVAGAYARSGHGREIGIPNGAPKIVLVQRLLRELGCTILGFAPRSYGHPREGVRFDPTAAVDARLGRIYQEQDEWQFGTGADGIQDAWREFRDDGNHYTLHYPPQFKPRTYANGELSDLSSNRYGRAEFTIRAVSAREGATLDRVYKAYARRFRQDSRYIPLYRRQGFLGRYPVIEVPMDEFGGALFIVDAGGRMFTAEVQYGEMEMMVRSILETLRPTEEAP